MFNLLLGGAVKVQTKRNSARAFLAIILIGAWFLRNIYQGYMFTFMQLEVAVLPPDTLQGLVEKKYSFLVAEEHFDIYRNISPAITNLCVQKNTNIFT